MSNYVIPVGGSGSKVAESLIHIIASGIIDVPEVYLQFVDQDEANGNVIRTMQLIKQYKAIYNYLKQSNRSICVTDILNSDGRTWTPCNDTKNTFATIMQAQNDKNYSKLFDVLYSPEEQKITLKDGFLGRPSIGAAVFFSEPNLEENAVWAPLIAQIKNDVQNGHVKIFLVGSIFGGTGAAGIPTLAKLIKSAVNHQNLMIGALLLMPYFAFTKPSNSKDTVTANSQYFILKSEVALKYYSEYYSDVFDKVYTLGNDNLDNLKKFSKGSNDQENKAHFVEFLGAFAIADFFSQNKHSQTNYANLLPRMDINSFDWTVIPDADKNKIKLTSFARFLALFHNHYNINKIEKHDYKLYPWIINYFGLSGPNPETLKKFEDLSNYAVSFFNWLAQIRNVKPDIFNLFSIKFIENNEKTTCNLNELSHNDIIPDLVKFNYKDDKEVYNNICEATNMSTFEDFINKLYNLSTISN